MTGELQSLIDRARAVTLTPEQKERQRISFAYGNAAFENPLITRAMVEEQARLMKQRGE